MGAKVNSITGKHEKPPLLVAAFAGHKLCVETLLSNGADHRLVLPNGNTVLTTAAANNKAPDSVKMLLLHGMTIRADTQYELHVAAEAGNKTKIEDILTKSSARNTRCVSHDSGLNDFLLFYWQFLTTH